MMKLSELFHRCAYDVQYQTVGNDVNYAFEEDGDSLRIYFQGSSSIWDWVRNFWFKRRPYKDMKLPYRVHGGFLSAWKEVEDTIIAKVTERDEFGTQGFKWKHITVVGYSHGGALAGLCHECVWYYRPDLREDGLEGYGFEAPRFYAGFRVRKKLRERWEKFTVIRDGTDIVTHCPPVLFGFAHVGKILRIEGDASLVENRLPKCVKYHYPQTVHDGLLKHEGNNDEGNNRGNIIPPTAPAC